MKEVKLTATKNEKLEDVKSETKSKTNNENQNETKNENQSETKNTPKKADLTNRKYSTLLGAAKAHDIDFEQLKTEAIKRLKDVITSAYDDIKRLHDSKTQVSDFIRMSRAEQSNKVLQISSGSLEQRLGYDRETYTSVQAPKSSDEAVLYTLLACIGWDATARLCGISDTPTAKKSKSEKGSNVVLDF